MNKARSFANSPANLLTTDSFVKEIKALFKSDKRYSVSVIDEAQLKKKKMNALLGVGQGSKFPSYLVDITYKGGAGDAIALVGKGVMFEMTGGISIKPSRNMKENERDMGGAAAVVGAAWAAGQLNLKRPFHSLFRLLRIWCLQMHNVLVMLWLQVMERALKSQIQMQKVA